MNKTELIASIVAKSNVSKKDVEAALKGFIDTVQETVAKDEKVQITGFGTFESRARNAREGNNPRTKEKIMIPATIVPAFKAGKEFKDFVKAADKEVEY